MFRQQEDPVVGLKLSRLLRLKNFFLASRLFGLLEFLGFPGFGLFWVPQLLESGSLEPGAFPASLLEQGSALNPKL